MLLSTAIHAQCFQVIDGNSNASATPQWISCTGGAFTLFIQTNQTIGAYIINWGDGTANSTGTGLVPPAFVSHTYAAAQANYTVTVTETGSGCVVTGTVVMEEPVNAAIQIPIGGATQVCAPGSIGFINASTNVSTNTTFIWNFGDGTGNFTFNHTNAGATVNHTYQRNTVNCVTTVTLSAENFCSFGTPTVASFNPLQVFDVDVAQITATATFLCYPDTVVSFTNTTAKNCVPQGNTAQRYEYWNFGDYWGLGYDSIVNFQAFDPPARPGYTIAYPGKGTYTIMLIDSNQCGRDTAFETVVIGDPPTANFTKIQDTVCTGEPAEFDNTSTGGANSYQWDFGEGAGFVTTGGANQFNVYNLAGTYTVTLIATIGGGSASCTDTIQQTIVVLQSPTAQFTINPAIGCDSFNVAFTNTSLNAVQWNWDFDHGGSTSTVQNPGTYHYTGVGTYNPDLIVTHSNGCRDTASETVTVYGSPIINFTPKNVCQNFTAQFLDSSYSTDGNPMTSWNWDFGDGGTSTQQNPNHLYATADTFLITLTAATAFCNGTDSFQVIVEPKPTAIFTKSDTAGCSPFTVSFTNTSLVGTVNNWDFGDSTTSTQLSPTHTFTNFGTSDTTYIVTLINETAFGCSDTLIDSVTVYPGPDASFTSNAAPGCGPVTVTFTNTSLGATSYIWDFGDTTGSTATDPTHIYQNQTLFIEVYQTKLIALTPNGCTDTAIQNITVYPEPIFGFTTNPDSGCSPLTVTFPSVIGAVQYAWDFDDGTTATGPTPTHQFSNGTTNNVAYNVRLVATSSFGCSDTTFQPVIVHPNPSASFTINNTVGCQPLDIMITNNSTGGTFFHWDFGNGDTSSIDSNVFSYTYTHSQAIPTFNDMRLIVETDRGCMDTLSRQVQVYPDVMANYGLTDTSGCSPLQVSFTDSSVNAQIFNWDFDDGTTTTVQSPTHTFVNTGTTNLVRQVELTSSSIYGCVDSMTQIVTVYPLPIADYTISDTVSCQPLVQNIANLSTGASNYYWFMGNGDTSLTPNANFSYTYTHTNPVPETYNFRLIAETNLGCRDTLDESVRVFPIINAGFIPSDTAGCNPVTVIFSDTSTGAQFYNWDFGDGSSSTQASVPHAYANLTTLDRTYTARMIASSVYGCVDTAFKDILVHPDPVARFTPSTLADCQPLHMTFQNTSIISVQNFWDFDDGDTSMSNATVVNHSFFNPTSNSLFRDVRLIARSQHGCEDTTVQTIEVYPQVIADFGLDDTAGCHALTVNFFDRSTNVQLYNWDFGDGGNDVIANPSHVFQNTNTIDAVYTVSLVVTSSDGCKDTAFQNITVYPQPAAAFTATPANQKFPSATVSFNNLTNPGTWNYAWTFDDGSADSTMTPSDYTYQTWGTFNITLHVYSANCADTATQVVVIDPPRAVVDFDAGGEGCRPLEVDFTNNTQYGVTYLWNFGDGGTSTLETPGPYTYYNAGTYSVEVTVVGPDGVAVTERLTDVVVAHEVSTAYFDVAPAEIVVPTQPVTFYNLSQNADTYLWDFGDSTFSDEENPEHYYQMAGEYTVTLYTNNQHNCPDSFVVEDAVFADSKGSIEFPTAFIPDPTGPNGGSYNRNSFKNDIFFPKFEGVIDYHLMIFNRWGELIFETFDVNIGWDGYHPLTGQLLQQDVYVWRAEVTFANAQKIETAGEVTLLR